MNLHNKVDLSIFKPTDTVEVRLRDGTIRKTEVVRRFSRISQYLYIVSIWNGNYSFYTEDGHFWIGSESPYDIIRANKVEPNADLPKSVQETLRCIEKTERKLTELKRHYEVLYRYSDISQLSAGEIMVDEEGKEWGVVKKAEGMALLIYSKFLGADESFPFKTSGTFDPSVHQLKMAKAVFPDWFSDDYWYATSDADKRVFNFYNDSLIDSNLAKTFDNDRKVRCEFRCVTFDND